MKPVLHHLTALSIIILSIGIIINVQRVGDRAARAASAINASHRFPSLRIPILCWISTNPTCRARARSAATASQTRMNMPLDNQPLSRTVELAEGITALTPRQKDLARKHGTPAEFSAAVWRAMPDFISVAEAQAACAKYEKDWQDAVESVAAR